MSNLTVGTGKQYSTIAAAVDAAQNGDIVRVDAGTYTNDFIEFNKDITLVGVGGMVVMKETQSPPNNKAMITETGNVTIQNFDISGVTVDDNAGSNGAAVRYQGGNLVLNNVYFHDNQNGILGAADPNGTISVDHSEFASNGVGGDGHTHNLYIGDIKEFTFQNSFSHDANVGHEIKSRAETTIVKDSRILDNQSTSSYSIDTPNGGNVQITGNVIQQGQNGQNPYIIAVGEEGSLHANSSLTVSSNTIDNDQGRGTAVWNQSGTTATVDNNTVYGLTSDQLVNGPANTSGNTYTGSEAALNESAGYDPNGIPLGSTPAPTPTPTPTPSPAPSSSESITLADMNGHHYQATPITSGTQTMMAASTGLDRDVTQSIGPDGVNTISTPLWNDVRTVNIHDIAGHSFATNAFLETNLSLENAMDGHVLLTNAKRGVIDISHGGNYTVTVNALSNAADPSNGSGGTQHLNDFAINTGSGQDIVTVNGSGALTHIIANLGSGHSVIYGENTHSNNTFTFGTGRAEITGGTGVDNYIYHANGGVDIIQNYDRSMDTITLDSSLKSSLHVSTGNEGTTLMFGSSQHEIVLHAIQNFDTTTIHWA